MGKVRLVGQNIKSFIEGRELLILFIVVALVHVVAGILINSFGAEVFKVGDQARYYQSAVEVAERISSGNFSFEGIWLNSWYPIVLGSWYAVLGSTFFATLLFNGLLAGATALGLYKLAQAIGVQRGYAFLAALVGAGLYPSYLYVNSFTMNDVLLVPLVAWGLWLVLRFLQKPSWVLGAVLFADVLVLHNVKYEIAVIFFVGCILAVPFLTEYSRSRRGLVVAYLVVLFAFIPLFSGQGVFGSEGLSRRTEGFSVERVTYLRERAYSDSGGASKNTEPSGTKDIQFDSSKWVSVKNAAAYSYSGASTLLGPFPWQMKRPVHWFALIEVVPWYLIFYFAVLGAIQSLRTDRRALVPVLFALALVGAIALISNNWGADMRFRIPAFMALTVVASLGLQSYLEKRQARGKLE